MSVAAAGLFDRTVAGSSAWYDVDVFVSNFPGEAAGWYTSDYLQPPASTALAIYVAATLYVTQPIVAVSDEAFPIVVAAFEANPALAAQDATAPIVATSAPTRVIA